MNIGDRMKLYEQLSAPLPMLFPLLPTHARLDGKCFSSFTRGLNRPYDERLTELMVTVTERLVEYSGALIGYTQSDEISLLWYSDNIKSQIIYNGRRDKIIGDLTARASLEFNATLSEYLPSHSKGPAQFDCRAWNTPTKAEAANAFLWRERDATRNSILNAGQAHFSPRQLHGKNTTQIQDMLHERGTNWNDYPAFFKRGIFVQRRRESTKFSAEELERLPPKHAARNNPDLLVERSVVRRLDNVPPFPQITNKTDFLFDGASPIVSASQELDSISNHIKRERIP